MSNWIETKFKIEEGNVQAQAAFNRILNSIVALEKSDVKSPKSQIFNVPVWELFEDWKKLVESGEDLTQEMGTSICNVGVGDNYEKNILVFESISEYPSIVCLRIAKEIMDIDQNSIISSFYWDESPDFIGYEVFADGEAFDEEYFTSDEYEEYEIFFSWNSGEEDEDEDDSFEKDQNAWERTRQFLTNNIKEVVEQKKEDRLEEG